MLTTQEAADLLNISRPTVVRLLADGEISYAMRGRHRRIFLRDALEYQERTRRHRPQMLEDIATAGEDPELYEATDTPAHKMRHVPASSGRV